MNPEVSANLQGYWDRREYEWRTWASEWCAVRLNRPFLPTYEPQVCAWLKLNAGDRYHAWLLPELRLIVFKDHDVAMQFALIFQ